MNKKALVLIAIWAGLVLISGIFVLLFGNTEGFKANLLLTLYTIFFAGMVAYSSYALFERGHFNQFSASTLLLVSSYSVVMYCIWINPIFYEQYWKYIHALVILSMVFAPATLFSFRFFQKK